MQGFDWKEEFLQGIEHSQVFCPVVSWGTLRSLQRHACGKRAQCPDNVLLELILARMLTERGRMKAVIPVLTAGLKFKERDFGEMLIVGGGFVGVLGEDGKERLLFQSQPHEPTLDDLRSRGGQYADLLDEAAAAQKVPEGGAAAAAAAAAGAARGVAPSKYSLLGIVQWLLERQVYRVPPVAAPATVAAASASASTAAAPPAQAGAAPQAAASDEEAAAPGGASAGTGFNVAGIADRLQSVCAALTLSGGAGVDAVAQLERQTTRRTGGDQRFFLPGTATPVQLLGHTLLAGGGRDFMQEKYTAQLQLGGRYAILYFGGSWCPACLDFLPALRESYRFIRKRPRPPGEAAPALVFVSQDRSADDFVAHFKAHGRWLAVPFAEERRRSLLAQRFGINAVPAVVILDPAGAVVTTAAADDMRADPEARGFPWPSESLSAMMGTVLVDNEGARFRTAEKVGGSGEGAKVKYVLLYFGGEW
jgi:thiol-disulfide isomerase/thioredoxin